ncbi:MAG TPA: xanthine dehydrogenase family protein molybdopterin-binding subunit [Actinomycetota bacterium]|nr:xanthine dehydrogenase family protein molybdopterin-binding subunit [Actinomycetota bacterium]
MSDRAAGPRTIPPEELEELRREARPPRHVGARLRRTEDRRLLTGRQRHVGDLRVPGLAHAAILRSSFPHARLTRVDVSGALAVDGVLAAFTADDLRDRVGPFVESGREEVSPLLYEKIDLRIEPLPMAVLADGLVHWVGQPIAAVVAEDRYVAEDALERVEVEYDPLPVVADAEAAIRPDAPVLHPGMADNVVVRFRVEAGDVEEAFRRAPRTLRRRFRMGRQVANAMEPRGVLAGWDAGREELTVHLTNARPHLIRTFLSRMLGLPADHVRVVAPDMGGSFGTGVFPEDVLIPFIAMALDRPVRWLEDRRENLANTRHARDQIHDVEVAFDEEGRILALRDAFLVDSGAYNPYAITVSYNAAAHLRGQYRIDHARIECRNVLTNKAPVTPVRGAGRPEALFVMDRILDVVARELDLDPIEVRRRNLIPPEAMPYPMGMPYRDGVDIVYDRADFPGQLEQALKLFDLEGFRAEQEAARREGRRLGVGVACYVEGSGYGPHEGAVIRIDPSGHVTVHTGAKPHGQGLETTLAQVCADQLGVRPEDVSVRAGDTALIAYGVGTFASRSAVTAGSAVGIAALRLRRRVQEVAAELLEVDPGDVEVEEGRAFPRGAPERGLTLAEVAAAAGPHPRVRVPAGSGFGLQAEYYFVPPTVTFSSGTHVVGVEVDEETGGIRLLRYVSVDDCGQMLNPTIVEGQIHGGIAHGIGNAILEEAVYDEEGQLLTGSYMDYLLPSPTEVPPIEVGHQEFPSELNPFGIKGVGEGGAVGPPAAIANAVVDALRPLRIEIDRVPLTPERLFRLIREARERKEAG